MNLICVFVILIALKSANIDNPTMDYTSVNIQFHKSCSFFLFSGKHKCNDDYSTFHLSMNIPGKGNLPVDGLGKYQLVSLNNIEALLYDKSVIKWDGSLTTCGSDKLSRFSPKKLIKNAHHDFNS